MKSGPGESVPCPCSSHPSPQESNNQYRSHTRPDHTRQYNHYNHYSHYNHYNQYNQYNHYNNTSISSITTNLYADYCMLNIVCYILYAIYCMPFVPMVVWSGSKQPRSPGAEQPTQVWAVSRVSELASVPRNPNYSTKCALETRKLKFCDKNVREMCFATKYA